MKGYIWHEAFGRTRCLILRPGIPWQTRQIVQKYEGIHEVKIYHTSFPKKVVSNLRSRKISRVFSQIFTKKEMGIKAVSLMAMLRSFFGNVSQTILMHSVITSKFLLCTSSWLLGLDVIFPGSSVEFLKSRI